MRLRNSTERLYSDMLADIRANSDFHCAKTAPGMESARRNVTN